MPSSWPHRGAATVGRCYSTEVRRYVPHVVLRQKLETGRGHAHAPAASVTQAGKSNPVLWLFPLQISRPKGEQHQC